MRPRNPCRLNLVELGNPLDRLGGKARAALRLGDFEVLSAAVFARASTTARIVEQRIF